MIFVHEEGQATPFEDQATPCSRHCGYDFPQSEFWDKAGVQLRVQGKVISLVSQSMAAQLPRGKRHRRNGPAPLPSRPLTPKSYLISASIRGQVSLSRTSGSTLRFPQALSIGFLSCKALFIFAGYNLSFRR